MPVANIRSGRLPSINRSINQLTSPSINALTNRSILASSTRSHSTLNKSSKHQSINQFSIHAVSHSTNQSINQSTNQPINQSIRSFSSHGHKSPLERYLHLVQQNKLRPDIRQEKTIKRLDDLYQRILRWTPPSINQSTNQSTPSSSGGLFSSFKAKLSGQVKHTISQTINPSINQPKGLYLYGGVGCGKTMLMNLFYDCIPERTINQSTNQSLHKGRYHFHSFMLGIHSELHKIKKQQQSNQSTNQPINQSYAIDQVATIIASKSQVLCLDEFQVTDVADAMILKNLFDSLWSKGVVLIATSNRSPKDLYLNGINRSSFLPFIDRLIDECEILPLDEGQDHRLLGTIDRGVYHFPLDASTDQSMNAIFEELSLGEEPAPRTINVMMGRQLVCKKASKTAAQFDFAELCDTALGASDYLAIADTFQYVLLKNVPILSVKTDREKIRRFITLLDVLYEKGIRLIISAQAKPTQLFDNGDVKSGVHDEGFASARAVSRLIEMQSEEYVQKRHRPNEQDED